MMFVVKIEKHYSRSDLRDRADSWLPLGNSQFYLALLPG